MPINENGISVERQYIGARYVPKFFMGPDATPAWVGNVPYEALTIVTYLGNSYTSKIPVPAGIGSPNNNPTYWALTGNFNAQIEQYHNELMLFTEVAGNVKAYGAKGDGITDDTQSILNTISLCDIIYVPSGEYKISQSITIPAGKKIICTGTLIPASTVEYAVIPESNTYVSVKIDRKNTTQEQPGDAGGNDIYILNCNNVTLDNCVIKNTGAFCAIYVGVSENITIQNCTIDTYVYTGIGIKNGCKNIKVNANTVLNAYGTVDHPYAITLSGGKTTIDTITDGCECIGNYIENQTPIWEGIDAHGIKNAVISNNVVKNCLTGIAMVGQDTLPQINVIVSNNTIIQSSVGSNDWGTKGIAIAGSMDSKNTIVEGNTIIGAGYNPDTRDKSGIDISGPNVSVLNNIISAHPSARFCIGVTGQTNRHALNLIIAGNVLEGPTIGIQVGLSSDGQYNGIIHDNVFNNFANAIVGPTTYPTNSYLYRVFCYNNTFNNCTTLINASNYGMYLDEMAMSPANVGQLGDFVKNTSYTTNHIIGWLCTSGGTTTEPATWTPITIPQS